jgi:amino acid transporter
MGTWQWMLMANSQGLTDGGRAGLFWTYIWTFLGYAFLAATLAEMASMAPTAGGQYHWVSELAPPKYQQVLSYASGWLSTLSWQAGNASGLFLAGVLIQILAKIRHPDYAAPAYQGWLLVVAVTAICVFFNIWAEPLLPYLQTAFLPVYVGTFIATVAVLWTIDSGVDARDALLELKDFGGWNSIGLALMVGQVGPIFALGGTSCEIALV